MGELQALIQDLDTALLNENKEKIYNDILLAATKYFVKALENVTIDFKTPEPLQVILNTESVPADLKAIINGDNARNLQLLMLLIAFCQNNSGNNHNAEAAELISLWHDDGKTATKILIFNNTLQTFAREKFWNKNIKIDDMRFLSPDPSAHTQSIAGKAKKKGKIYAPFKTGLFQLMNTAHYKNDIDSKTLQLTNQQKKQFKVRFESGKLTRGHQAINEGRYIFAVTPKGSLYIVNDGDRVNDNSTKHHSTPRAGQPVLAAGHVEIIKDPQTDQMRIASIDRHTGHYGTETRNLLLIALWLKEQNIIDDKCELKGIKNYNNSADKITVNQLLTDDEFAQIRADYAQAKLEAERLTPERVDMIEKLKEYIRIRKDALDKTAAGGKTRYWLSSRNKNRELNVAVAEKLLLKLQDTSITSDKILENIIKPKIGVGFSAYVASNSKHITVDSILNANATNSNTTFAISGDLPNIIRSIKSLAKAEQKTNKQSRQTL